MTFTHGSTGIRQFLLLLYIGCSTAGASAQTTGEPADYLLPHPVDTLRQCLSVDGAPEALQSARTLLLTPTAEQITPADTTGAPDSDITRGGEGNEKPQKPTAPEANGVAASADSLGVFDMVTNLPTDWYNWSKQTFTTDNIPLISALGVMTAAMVVTDYELWQPAKKIYAKSQLVRDVSDRFVDVGDGKFQFGLAVGFGLYGAIFSDKLALRTASQVTEVILACGTVVQLLKHITGRESPFTATTRTGNWTLFPNQIEYHKHVPHYDAFPSGHIATAMATMIVISENYPKQKWIKYIGYPAVALVGVGLTTTSIHWVSDFPLGLALGYSFGMLVAHRYDAPGSAESASSASVPRIGFSALSDGTPTMQFTWQW